MVSQDLSRTPCGLLVRNKNISIEIGGSMPYKQLKDIALSYGFQRLKKYKQIDAIHYSAHVGATGLRIVINVSSQEVFLWNPFMKKLVKQ